MDGKTLRRSLANLINEDPDTSGYLDERTSYEFLWDAAIESAQRTHYLTARGTITTTADGNNYTLPADFLGLYMRDSYKRLFLKYNDGTSDFFPYWRTEEDIFYNNQTDSVSIPGNFYVTDATLSTEKITGTATTPTGTAANGESTLTDSGSTFVTDDVQPGDVIHNATSDANGIVLSVTSETVLIAALFNGTNQDFTINDTFTIVLQPRLKLVFESPTSTAGHTATVPYIQRPAPVFSDFGRYRFPLQWSDALVRYAAWKDKYRDEKQNEGDKWYIYWDSKMKQLAHQANIQKNTRGYRLIMRGPSG